MKVLIFHLLALVLCYRVVVSQGTPAPPEADCPYVDLSCPPGLPTTSETFSQNDVCKPLTDPAVAGAGMLIFGEKKEHPIAFKCPNVYGLRMALVCFPPDFPIPFREEYCICDSSAYPKFKISEVPDIKFELDTSEIFVTEDEERLTVCAVSGQLAEEYTPMNVVISTVPDTAEGHTGSDFVSVNEERSFTQSNQKHCVDIAILKDDSDERDESFYVELKLKYAFDVPLDKYKVTIIDSDVVGVGFENAVYAKAIAEDVNNFTICVITNVTLNGDRTASAVLRTEDLSAKAGSDYLAAHEPIVFRVNGEGRACVNITIINDKIIDEPYEVFLIHLTSTDASVFASRTAVVILDQDDRLYPFGREAGDEEIPTGIVASSRTRSPSLTLEPSFRFFGKDETTLYVNLNGVVSFNQACNVLMPQPFPYKDHTMISLFWENFETARFGHVYYRTTTDRHLLTITQRYVEDTFPSIGRFHPSHLLIATWDKVPQNTVYSGGHTNLVNTLQVVLTTDGEKSFVFFIYADVQWGEGGIGFNAGDGVRFFELPRSRTPEAREVEDSSNVGVEGVYAYRVDETDIIGPEVEHYEGIQIGFEQRSYTVSEGDGSIRVCAHLKSGTISFPVSIQLITVDTESAQAGKDYKKQKTELTFESDTQRLCSEIEIIPDDLQEDDESFMVLLCTVQTHTVSLDPQIASVVITDDDANVTGGSDGHTEL